MLVVSPWTLFLLASDDRCSSNYFEDYCEEESNRTIKTFVRIIISGRFNATNLTKSFLYGPNPASFWFSSFSQNNNRYWQYIIWLKNHRWCAWDLNLGPQDGRRRWIHWTMVAPFLFTKCILEILLSGPDVISVTKLGDLLDFGQLFKAFGIN